MDISQHVAIHHCMTAEEALLEEARQMILGGIMFEAFDGDDLPIAARIAAANEAVYGGARARP